MKRLLFILLALPFFAHAQHKALLIEGSSSQLYLTHTVAAKENLYSIGRLYNVSPKEIAPFNKLDIEKGLNLNQVIRIPLTETNFGAGDAAADEALVPVYYTVKDKDGLYKISAQYNKVPVASLKKWNNLKGENIASGNKLIVGYLRVKKELSAFAKDAKAVSNTVAASTAPVSKPEPTKPTPATTKPDISNETLPVVKNPTVKTPAKEPVKVAEPIAVKEPVVIKEPATKKEPVVTPTTNNSAPQPVTSKIGRSFNGGLFKAEYEKQSGKNNVVNESGWAAIFKSTSGWDDGKYYCLHNGAMPGSIIKITNKTNGKSVYAKVLDAMPDIRQNNELIIRLSNAAADELGASESKFDCALSFSK
ncbi:MAG: hypothetical protein RLY16_2051 [Bacteroidota bacterium]